MRAIHIQPRSAIGVFLIIASCALTACFSNASDKELIDSARSYMEENQVRAASIQLKNVLQANPKNAEARYLLGQINLQVGDYASAEKEFERAQSSGWNAESSTLGKMRAMIAQRKYKDILEDRTPTDSWTETAKANLKALEALANAGEGDLLQAKKKYLLAEKLDANAYDVLKLAVLLQLADKQNKEAGSTLTRALELYPQDPELMLTKAKLAVSNKQDKEAIRAFEQVINAAPEDLMTIYARQAYLELLKLAIQNEDVALIKKSRDALVANNIDGPEANYYLALAAYTEKNYDVAEEHLQKILRVSTSHGPTLLLSGSVSYAKRDFEKAAYYLSKYIVNYPENYKAKRLLGRTYLALGQNEEARKEFNAILNENENDAELIALVGLSEINRGQVQSGIIELEKAQAMAPESSALKLELAKAYIADGQTDKAIKQLDEVLQSGGNLLQINTVKVLAYLQARDINMAMSTARQMLVKSPDNPDVFSLMGSIQLAAGDIHEARKYFNKALAINAEHKDSQINLARLDEQQGDTASAEKRYLSILKKNPGSIDVMNSLARLAQRQGDSSNQIKWLQMARQADSNELFSRVALIEIYLKNENIAEAETILQELEKAHLKEPEVLAVKSRLLMEKKRFTEAAAVISEFIDAKPDMDIGYYLQAQNQLALSDKKAALSSIRKAYSIKPDVPRNIILLATVEQSNGNYDRAMKLAEEVIKVAPDSAVGYVLKGDTMLATQKDKQALASFDKAWSITKSRDIALRRFKVTRKIYSIEQAAPVLAGWLEREPDDTGVMLVLATAYITDKQNSKAVPYFEKLFELEPDNIIAVNNLAWLYGRVNDPRALALAEKAYSLQPDSPSIMDTYGWILLKNNKTAEALTMLKQAADKLPTVPEVQYHYAKALFSNGETAAARKILKPLIESGKSFDGRNDAKKMLTQ